MKHHTNHPAIASITAASGFLIGIIAAFLTLEAGRLVSPSTPDTTPHPALEGLSSINNTAETLLPSATGRPQLFPKPEADEVWECDVVVIGGSLGGVAAASHAMKSGAQTCLIELTPWLGGQVSAQGVSAIDESQAMRRMGNFSQSWIAFKRLIEQQPLNLPVWSQGNGKSVRDTNSCWVGKLCFPPNAGAMASQRLLEQSAESAPQSRWATSTAFKGAEFDSTGTSITTIHAVRRIPRKEDYIPEGRPSVELPTWYSWADDQVFEKVSLRLQAPANQSLLVIDATDTAELVAWSGLPYRVGSDSRATTGEVHAADFDNPECTQAFTFPFALAIHDDGGKSLKRLEAVQPEYNVDEHWQEFSLNGFSMFSGRSVFNYRRMISQTRNDPMYGTPVPGDITLVNWNPGNDWNWMDPPLLLLDDALTETGQSWNWMGGLSISALQHGEYHALLFARWLIENQSKSDVPLSQLAGDNSPLGTESGLSMMPYFREGRRILGRAAYGQPEFYMREADVRRDLSGGRDLSGTAIALVHYDIDIHGCRYRNWLPSGEATKAPANESLVHPIAIPLESLIPQEIDNLLMGGKGIAVSHIVNAATRVHYSEWSIGAAAGATAGWLVKGAQPDLMPADIVANGHMRQLQTHLEDQGLRLHW
ncbi:MAG: FAD-dependent oxidoreductase [Elainellaceae cyanobacterium]